MPVEDLKATFGADADLVFPIFSAFEAESPARIAVAVSGGSDSMACLHLAWRAAEQMGWALSAVTVDHALRDGSAAEAQGVAAFCERLGIPHQVLRWEHGTVAGNLMEAARKARYALMADWAAAQGISHILVGHTAEDQAETFLMELARSAGIDGLVGMPSHFDQGGVRFMRPLLLQARAALRAYLTRQGIGWTDDPSNENERFTRVRARRALKALQPLGITVDKLTSVMVNLRLAQDAVRMTTLDASERICTERAGEAVFDLLQWRNAATEVQRRLLIAALRWNSGVGYAPRGSSVTRMMISIAQGHDATLAGCRVRVGKDCFRVVREPKAATMVALPGQIWDGRWQVTGPFAQGQRVAALGASGLRQCKNWRTTGHTRDSLLVSPAVWYDETLIAAPIAGHNADFSARIVASFTDFILSH